MAKTSYITISPELEEKYYSDLQARDRFITPGIRSKAKIISRKKRAILNKKTFLKICSNYWDNFSPAEKQAWEDVSPYDPPHGWRTFVNDQCLRISLGLEGVATPNEYHQGKVGFISIEAPSEEIKLIQPHPSSYWIKTKVVGKPGMYKPEEITEILALPLQIGISYKSDLVSTGDGSFAKFYASVRRLYQGQNLDELLEVDIPLSSAWTKDTATLSSVIGTVTSYSLYIHLYKVTGELLFDNVIASHSGSNWARDRLCESIEEEFSRAYFQVPQHWAPVTKPAGSDYQSIYPTS